MVWVPSLCLIFILTRVLFCGVFVVTFVDYQGLAKGDIVGSGNLCTSPNFPSCFHLSLGEQYGGGWMFGDFIFLGWGLVIPC